MFIGSWNIQTFLDKMCIRVILLVGLCGGWIYGQQAPPLIATSAPKTYDPNCVDKMANCWDMPESSCHAPYEQWALDNCPNRCGKCIGPTTPKPECKDKLPDCEAYDKKVCSNPDYTKWVGENCRYYCRMCTAEELARMDAMQTTIPPAKCKDKVDCRAYGANACSDTFKAWSKDNCANYCGYCKGLPTPPPACIDHIPNCNSYDADTCTNPNYRLWAEDNCKKFCGLCPGRLSNGGAIMVPTPGGNAVPVIVNGRDVPVISYAPPTPPKPGKRHVNAPPVKRQFHASHHHSGQTNECWDSNSPECQSGTIDKIKDENTSTTATTDILGKDFPGSEFKPRPTPDKNWDSKPSTEAPEPTIRTSETTSASTTTTNTPSTFSSSSSSLISSPGLSKEPSNLTTEPSITSTAITMSSLSTSSTSSSVITSSEIPSASTSEAMSMSSESTTLSRNSSLTQSMTPPTVSSTELTTNPTETSTQVKTSQEVSSTRLPSQSPTSRTTPTLVTSTRTPSSSDGVLTSKASSSASSTLSTVKAPPMKSTQPTVQTQPMSSTAKSSSIATSQSTVTKQSISTTNKTPEMTSTESTVQTQSMSSTDKVTTTTSTKPTIQTQSVSTTDKAPPMISKQTTIPPQTLSTGPPPTITRVSSTDPPVVTTQVTSSTELTTQETCEDTVDNCIQYGPLICETDEYIPWAKAHCRRFCKFCLPVTMTPFVCKNKRSNCNQYDSGDLCTALAYYGWSRENCYAYCGFPPCDKTTPPMG